MHQLELALGQAKLKLRDIRLLVCTHSHTDHYGLRGPDRRRGRLRALDAPGVGARAGDGRGPRPGARAADRGRPPERRPGRGARALRGARAGDEPAASTRSSRPTASSSTGSTVATDLGFLQRLRDARARALPRRPARARERPADLRRPPARPHLALLRPRPHPRPGRRVPRLARRRRRARRPPLPARPRPPLPRRRRQDRGLPQGASPSSSAGSARRSQDGEKTAFDIVGRSDRGREPEPAGRPPGACRSRSPTSITSPRSARPSRSTGTRSGRPGASPPERPLYRKRGVIR